MTPPRNAIEVNFYHRNLGCASGARRLKLLAALILIVILICLFWSYQGWSSTVQLKAKGQQLSTLPQNDPKRVTELRSQHAEQERVFKALNDVATLSNQLQHLTNTLGSVDSTQLSVPAAQYMKTLSEAHVEDVWLESIEFEQTSRFALSGWTTNGKQLPALMRSIASTETFGGYSVGMIDVARGKDNQAGVDAIHFKLEGRAKP